MDKGGKIGPKNLLLVICLVDLKIDSRSIYSGQKSKKTFVAIIIPQ